MQSYYAVAARMGDADAQMDLAFCLANGKGAKKDRKEAAKWYRAAVCLIPFFFFFGHAVFLTIRACRSSKDRATLALRGYTKRNSNNCIPSSYPTSTYIDLFYLQTYVHMYFTYARA